MGKSSGGKISQKVTGVGCPGSTTTWRSSTPRARSARRAARPAGAAPNAGAAARGGPAGRAGGAPGGVAAHAGDGGGGVPEPRGGHGDVGRAAAEELAEGGDVLEAHAPPQGVDVDPAAAHDHHVGCVLHGVLRPCASSGGACRLCATAQSGVKTLSGHSDSKRSRRLYASTR